MGAIDAPAWILAAWRRSLRAVGATAEDAVLDEYGRTMIQRWSASERIHHNLRRLISVLARVDELAPETHDPAMVRLAAWYHGSVFDAAAQNAYAHRGGIDEAASADLARTELRELGVPGEVVERIAALILTIAHHAASKSDIDAQALCDADLGGLAVEPQRYEAYRKEVRAEYSHIPQSDYLKARIAIISKLLSRPHLFQSPMAQMWEDAARENLTAELARLKAEAGKLAPESSERDQGDQTAEPTASTSSSAAPDVNKPDAARGGTDEAGEGASSSSAPAPESFETPVREFGPPTQPIKPHPLTSPGPANSPTWSEGHSTSHEPAAGAAQTEKTIASDRNSSSPAARPEHSSAPEPTEARDANSPFGQRRESLAERSQRRWEEIKAAEANTPSSTPESVREERRERQRSKFSSPSAPSPATATERPESSPPPVESEARKDKGEQAEDIDKLSSLSRPPRKPAVKPHLRDSERKNER